MKKKVAHTPKGDAFSSESHKLQCSICGEVDRDSLVVEDICIGYGMGGDVYSFCDKCWNSKHIGKNILALIGAGEKLKYIDNLLEITEVEI